MSFALDPAVVYLNHGSYGATPVEVLQAQRAIQDRLEAQPMAFFEGLGAELRGVMVRVAATLGAPVDDLVFVDNASTGTTAVLRSLELGPEDVILCTSHGYAAVDKALAVIAARTGCSVVQAQVPWPIDDAAQVIAAVQAAWTPSVTVAVLDHITSASAIRFPLETLVPWLRTRGTRVLVDGAHVPGQHPVQLEALGADWYTGNLHKWAFTPKGVAVLYARPDAQDGLLPLVYSHGLRDGLVAAFEHPGTRDPSGWLAAGAAWDFAERHGGFPAIQARNSALASDGADLLVAELGGRRLAAPPLCDSMVSVELRSVAPTVEAARGLMRALVTKHRVQTWVMPLHGRSGLRISAQLYNELADVERLVAALKAEGVS
jgi:isopenicillin-N epimerase